MVVARRSTGTNVRRNRMKRLIREIFRLRQEGLSGWDWVVRLKKTPDPAQEAVARAELARLLTLPAASPPGVPAG